MTEATPSVPRPARRASRKAILRLLIVFGLPFAAVGVGMAIWLAGDLAAHLRMRSWREVPARIVHTELKVLDGGECTTFLAKVEYVYQYQGRQYTARRVSINDTADNIGSFHRDVYRQLSRYQKSGQPFPCYVNPARPAEAVLFRDLRFAWVIFKLGFVMAFGGVGFGAFAIGVFLAVDASQTKALVAAEPDSPWLWRRGWADGKIVSSSKTLMLALLAVAAFWNAVSAPLWFLLWGEVVGMGNRWALLALIVPAIGMALVCGAISAAMRWRKYGRSVFQMAAVPGVIGGRLAGVIRTSVKIWPQRGFRLTLRCRETVASGASLEDVIRWEDEQVVTRELLPDGADESAIPVLFQIPYQCRQTDDQAGVGRVAWRLEAAAAVPGLDYRAAFEVPVFKTAESDPDFTPDERAIAEYVAPASPDQDLRLAGVRKTPSPAGDGERFVFPLCRNLGLSVFFSLFFLGWSGMVFLMFYWQALIVLPIVFGLVGALLLWHVVDLWFYRSVVDASPRGLAVAGGWFGLGRPRWIEAAQVEKIEAAGKTRSDPYTWYDLVVVRGDGKRMTAAKRLGGQRLANSIIRQIEQAMGRCS
jgi:hypothetical protein